VPALLQVGVTAMLIASKYEEIWAPEVKDFVYISDRAYTREQIIAMEKLMLNTLGFNLTLPTPYNFLARFLKAAGAHLDKNVRLGVCMRTCVLLGNWRWKCAFLRTFAGMCAFGV
jgi:hypothetical protein